MWRCPLCQLPLNTDNPWHCENNHTFDVSKRGYVNLLPVHKKASKEPGDNKTMMSARQTFHRLQGYQPLMATLTRLITEHVGKPNISLYDAGCGEGTYLATLQQGLMAQDIHVEAAGSDISKAAIDFAARQHKAAQFVVASSFDLPVTDSSTDVVLQVFAPGSDTELSRILNNDGVLLHVAPGPEHLMALKCVAYASPKSHDMPADTRQHLTLLHRERLQFHVELKTEEQALALLMMTPFTWRLDDEQKQSLAKSLRRVEADFVISVWKKHH